MAKTLKATIAEGTAWMSGGALFLKLVGFLSIFLILRTLTVYEYGVVELAFSIVGFLNIFLLPGVHEIVIADMGIEKSRDGGTSNVKRIFLSFFYLQFMLAVVAWAIVFFGAQVIAMMYQNDVGYYLKIISFSFLAVPIGLMFNIAFSVYFKFVAKSIYVFAEEGMKLVFLFIFLVFLGRTIDGVLYASVLAQFSALLIMLPAFLSVYRQFSASSVDISFVHVFQTLSLHRKWGLFSSYLDTFGKNIRLWIIKLFLGTEAVGIFAAAQGLLGHAISLIPLNKIIAPIIPQYVDQKERFYKIINKGAKYQFLSYMAIGAGTFFAFPFVIHVLFPRYIPSIDLFKIMLISLVPASFAALFTSVFYALQAQKNLFYATIYKTVLILVVTPICIYFFGAVGIAYAYVAVIVFYTFERYRVLRHKLPDFRFRIRDFLTLDGDDLVILTSIKAKIRGFMASLR
jgi:O-antigen/teichoic acid export membrane protein